jgi:hypothetical protein
MCGLAATSGSIRSTLRRGGAAGRKGRGDRAGRQRRRRGAPDGRDGCARDRTGGTIVAAIVGAAVTLKGARNLSRDERVAAERTEDLRAFRVFVASASLSVSELRQLPPVPEPRPGEELVGRVVDTIRGEAATKMATRRKVHQEYGI